MNSIEKHEQLEKNNLFLSDISSADEGIRKSANDKLKTWLSTYKRQDGVWRKVRTPEAVTESDFVKQHNSRDLVVIRDIKPRSAGAMSTNFDTGTISTSMNANTYRIFLHRAWTPKYRIEKNFLVTYDNSLLDVYKDLSLQDLLGNEDLEGMSITNANVGAKGVVNEDIGITQYIDAGANITPDNIAYVFEGLTHSTDNHSPTTAMVHRSFWYRMLSALKASEYGDGVAQDALLGNLGALEESLFGIKVVTVLDKKLIPANTMYVFASTDTTGAFLTYGEAEVLTELKDSIWYEFFAYETYGMSMPYRGCVVRADFGSGNGGVAMDWETGAAE